MRELVGYSQIMSLGGLFQNEQEGCGLCVIERPQLDILANLPKVMYRHRYGM